MSTGSAFEQSLQLRSVSNLRIFLVFNYGILKLAFRARKLSGAFEKWVPGPTSFATSTPKELKKMTVICIGPERKA